MNSELLKVSVTTNDEQYDLNVEEELKINRTNLSESYIDQPAKFAWYAVLAAKASAQAYALKNAIDQKDDYIRKQLTGKLDAEVRKQLELDGEKVTEGKVTNAINCHEEYLQEVEELNALRDKYVLIKEDADILMGIKEAFDQRKDMLISLGAQMRADMSNLELTMKEEEYNSTLSGIDTKAQASEVIKTNKATKRTRKSLK